MKLNTVLFKSTAMALSFNLILTWPGPLFTADGYAADLQEQKQVTTVPTTSLAQLQSSQKKPSLTNTSPSLSSSMLPTSIDFLGKSAPISRVINKKQSLIAPATVQNVPTASTPSTKSKPKASLKIDTSTSTEETDARKQELLKRVDETTTQTDDEINKLRLEQEKAIALFNEWAKSYNVSVSSLDAGMKTMSESLEKLLADPSLPETVLSGIRDLNLKVRDLTSPENVNNFQQLSVLYYDYEKAMKTVVPFFKLSSLQAFRKDLDDYRAKVLAAQTLEELAALAAKFPAISEVYPAPLLRREDFRPLARDLILQGTVLISDAKSYQNAIAAVKVELINHFGLSQADIEKVIVKVDLKTLEVYAAIDLSVALPHRPDQVMMPNVLGVSELPSEISFKLQILPGLQPAVLCMADSYCQSWANDYHLESAKFVLRDQIFELAYGLPMYVSKDPSLPVAVQFGTPNVLNSVKIADKTGVRVREINFFRFMDSKDLEARITDFSPSLSASRKRIVTMGDMGDGRLSIRRVAEYRTDNTGNNVLSVNNEFEYISTKGIPPVVRFRSIKRTDTNGILLSTITPVEIVTATQITDPLNGSVTTVMPNDRFVADIALPGGAVARVAFESLWELMDLAQQIEKTPTVIPGINFGSANVVVEKTVRPDGSQMVMAKILSDSDSSVIEQFEIRNDFVITKTGADTDIYYTHRLVAHTVDGMAITFDYVFNRGSESSQYEIVGPVNSEMYGTLERTAVYKLSGLKMRIDNEFLREIANNQVSNVRQRIYYEYGSDASGKTWVKENMIRLSSMRDISYGHSSVAYTKQTWSDGKVLIAALNVHDAVLGDLLSGIAGGTLTTLTNPVFTYEPGTNLLLSVEATNANGERVGAKILKDRLELIGALSVYKLSHYNQQDPSLEMFRITVLANNKVEVLWRWNSADLPLTILGTLDPSSGMITIDTNPADPANATQAIKTNNEMVRNYYGNQMWKIQMVPYPDSDFKAGYIHMASLERSLRDASKPFSTEDDMTYHKVTYKWNARLGRDAIDTVEKKFENFRQFAQFKVAARQNSATGQTFYREEQDWMDFFVKGASGVEERTLRRTFYAKTNEYNSELLHVNYLLSGDLKNLTAAQLAAIDLNNNAYAVKVAPQEAAAPLWYSIDYGPIYRWNDWQKDASGVIARNPKSHNDYLGFGLNFTNWKYLGKDSQGKEIWDQDDVEVINYPAQNYVYLSQRAMNGGYEDYHKYMISRVNGNITLAEAAYAWKIQTTTESHGHFKNLMVAMGTDGIPELRYSGDFSYGDVNGAGQNIDRMRPLKGVKWDAKSKTMSWLSADESLVIAVTLDSALTQVTKVLITEKDAEGNFGRTEYFYDTLVKRSWIDNPSNIPGWGTMLQLPTRRIYQWRKKESLNSYDLLDAEYFVFDGSGNYRDRFRIEDDKRDGSGNTIASYERNDSNIRNIYYTNNLNGTEYSGIGAKSTVMDLLNFSGPVTDVSGMQTAMRTLAVYRNVERVSGTWDNFTYSVQSTKKAGEPETAYIARLIKVYKNLGGSWNGNQYDSYIVNSNFNQALLNTVYTQSAIASFVINQAAAGTLTKLNQSFYAFEGNTPSFQNALMQGINPPFMAHFGYGESLNQFKSQNYRGQPSEDARYQGYYGLRLQRQFALAVADSDQPTQVFTETLILDYPNETMVVINDRLYNIEIINGNVLARDMQPVITALVNLFGLSPSDVMKALKQGTFKGKVDRLTSKLTLTMGPGLFFAKSIDQPYLLNLVDQVSLPSAINFQLAFYDDQFAIVSGDFSLADHTTPSRSLSYRFSYTNNSLSDIDVYDGQNLIKQIMNISGELILVSDPVNSTVQEITVTRLADGKRHIASIVKKVKDEELGCGGVLAPVQSTQVFNYGCPPGTNCLMPTTLIGIDSYNGAISISGGAIKLPTGVNKTWTVNHFGAAADAFQADLKLASVEGVFRIAFKTLPDLLAQVEKFEADFTKLTQQEKDWLVYTKIYQSVSPAAPIKIVMQSVINSLTALQRDFYIHEYQLKQWASTGKLGVEFINNGGAYTVAFDFKTSPPKDQDVWPLWAVKLDAFNNKFKIPQSIIFKVDNISLAVGGVDFFQTYKSTDPAASVKSFSASYSGGALTALQKFKAFFVGGITVASSNPVWESIAIPGDLNGGVYMYCYDTSCNGSIPSSGSAHPYAAVYKSLTVTYESTYTFKTITEARRDGMTISNSFVNNETIMGDVYSQITRSTGTTTSQAFDEDMVSGTWRTAVDVVVGNATYRMFYDGSVFEMLQKARSVELNPGAFSDEENEWKAKIPTAQTKAAIQAVLQAVNALERDFSFSKHEMKRWLWQGKVSITYDSTNSKVNFAFADSLKGTSRNLYERVILNPFSNSFEVPDSISVSFDNVSKAVTQLTLLDAGPNQTGFNKIVAFYKTGTTALLKLEEYKANTDGSYPTSPYQIVEILNNTDRYNSVYKFTNTDPEDPVAVRVVKFQWGTYVKEITETFRDSRVIRTIGELISTIMGDIYFTNIKRYDLTLNPSAAILPPPISELTVTGWVDYSTVSYTAKIGTTTSTLNLINGHLKEFLAELNKLEREKYGVNVAFADLVSSFGVSSAAVSSGKIKFAIDAASKKLIMVVDPSVTLSAAPDQPFLAPLLGFSAMPARMEFSLQQTSAGFELSTAAFSVGGLTYNLTYSNSQLSQVDVYSGSTLVKQVTNYSTNLITVYAPALNQYTDYTIVTWADGSRHITNIVSRSAVILKWGGCDGD